jgi:hypothetical protein
MRIGHLFFAGVSAGGLNTGVWPLEDWDGRGIGFVTLALGGWFW